jgi:predicted CopG family antitoxin
MTKVIRITESTYDELVKEAHYQDTIDSIIQGLLKYRKTGGAKENE